MGQHDKNALSILAGLQQQCAQINQTLIVTESLHDRVEEARKFLEAALKHLRQSRERIGKFRRRTAPNGGYLWYTIHLQYGGGTPGLINRIYGTHLLGAHSTNIPPLD